MPAVLDNTSTGNNNASASSLSWSHTLGNLGGSGLVVVGATGETSVPNHPNSVITGVTFNGVAMTKVKEDGNAGGSQAVHVSMWELHGANVPAAGTYTIVVTYTGATTSQAGGAMSFKNARPQTAEASASASLNQNLTPSASVTTLSPNALLVSIFGNQNGGAASSSTSDSTGFQAHAASTCECDGFYRNVVNPASSTVTLSVANPEAEALVVASFAILNGGIFPQI